MLTALVIGITVIVAGFSSKTTTLAFIQDSSTYRKCAQSAVEDDRERRIKIFGAFIISSPFYFSSRALAPLANANQAEEAEPDLFDYWDPLLSPHAYPSGISPKQKSPYKNNDEIQEQRQNNLQQYESSETRGQFGFRLSNTDQTKERKISSSTKGELGFKVRMEPSIDNPNVEEKFDEDLFDYFDPLKSPHEYPEGIKSKRESKSSLTAPPALEIVEDIESSSTKAAATNSINTGKKKKIGVLLIDHGSKKEKSNARLQAMAKLYEMTLGSDEDEEYDNDDAPTIIVRAAHMEIATPSIPDGLKDLKDQGVDEIICHPFFLSADGRHVKEDIPEIIGNAVEDLWGQNSEATPIPIVTTAPVGSNTQLMLGAIHSLVRENSQFLKTTLQNNM